MHGFLRDASGNYTAIDDPDAQVGGGSGEGTWVLAINANGAATGYYSDTHTAGPGAINNAGRITGIYFDPNSAVHGFVK